MCDETDKKISHVAGSKHIEKIRAVGLHKLVPVRKEETKAAARIYFLTDPNRGTAFPRLLTEKVQILILIFPTVLRLR
jgi:hypothetical protein